mmetsp:Transcript_12547/g.22444  ORF Transcript_12547/g.22444 Transcript_12547/m.22444 type:complete len:245 (-) Transcript_12547:410-1144(-)|eukprot:CAMPEP_0175053060 /NCGR_PEP_ID=MMETSP0052_2-20121109/8709_1 /TAXON_ID=51329 ORGANISM="Polytomella parva, Strain SAG 63-3" /NCGR_SAMPLE_ID=MMETSP0052_2 /ASSEMBLY_ACC=CAM_ASM_000194 /LENGTH=244 /DNA_ID=CAMNT_0016317541 /DNA_START=281 /DNA_END=1015 /DNA_ORIENTATION=+
MGKGSGNVCGKMSTEVVDPSKKVTEPSATVTSNVHASTVTSTKKTKIFIIYYSTYGHVQKMAEKVKEGVDKVPNCEATIYQVPETLPAEVLEKMHAPPKAKHPIITADMLTQADGFIFGFPTRFGMMCSQMIAFFDSTGQLWQQGALMGKCASMFTSTGVINGGNETTLLATISQLSHHGIIFVPMGFGLGAPLFDVEVPRGGSAYGAGTIAGPTGGRQPSEVEFEECLYLGKTLAGVAKKLSS